MDIMRRILLWIMLISLAGCAGLGYREDSVKVTLSSLQLMESTLMEQRYLVKLRLQNRSQRTLTVNGMSFDVELNGKDFASGVSNQEVSVAAFDEATVEVKVSSSLFGIIRQIQSMQNLESRAFQYEISGRVHTGNVFTSLPFKEAGVIDLGVPSARQMNAK
jgi:LEA14-like dessication related protein